MNALAKLVATHLAILILASSYLVPMMASRGVPPGEIDLPWLEEQTSAVLENNRVTEQRTWNRREELCVFHAPSLEGDLPSWLPGWLRHLWQNIMLPWQQIYPHQWFWDSCAHAIVLSSIDVGLAEKEIESLLYAQREDGFIPHMIWNKPRMHWVDRLLQLVYPSRHTSAYIQPPALAQAVEAIYGRSGDIEFVRRVLPQLKRYYLYLDKERDRNGDNLIEIIISYESGKDRSPEYDPVYGESNAQPVWRGPMLKLMLRHRLMGWDMNKITASNKFRVKDVLVNCIYAQNLFALGRLCQVVEDNWGEFFHRQGLKVEEAILSQMYDEESGLFYSLDARRGQNKQLEVNTISSLMPLMLDNIDQGKVERLIDEHLLNPQEYWLRYPLPVVPLESVKEEREDHIIWRGLQTWVYPNWYIAKGLRKQAQRFPEHFQEYNRIADELALRTYELVRRQGFCDLYHSQSGDGSACCPFSWSTLVLDMALDAARAPGASIGQ